MIRRMKLVRQFISLDKSAGIVGKTRVKVFYLNDPESKKEYERILNTEEYEIINESPPSTDKIGRVFVFLKWLELNE